MGKTRKANTAEESGQLTEEELEREHAEPLPDREQMSVIRPSWPPLPADPSELSIEPVPPETT